MLITNPFCLMLADPPRIRKVGPTRLTTAPLYSEATFSCEAEGNPPPTYQWLQKVPTAADTLFTRGSDSKLRIANISYDYQGEYTCKVSNFIGDIERTVESEPITIQVVGKSMSAGLNFLFGIISCRLCEKNSKRQ